ncbi:MAG: hypothetical protein ACO1PZ_02820 [Gammaproteobacteria bacterium]
MRDRQNRSTPTNMHADRQVAVPARTSAKHERSATSGTPVLGAREPFVPLALATLAAPLLWALHFAFVYLLEGFLCAPPDAAAATIPAIIIVATLIGAGLCAWSLFAGEAWLQRAGVSQVASHAFLRTTQCTLAGLSLVAILWSGAGALMLGPCVFAY